MEQFWFLFFSFPRILCISESLTQWARSRCSVIIQSAAAQWRSAAATSGDTVSAKHYNIALCGGGHITCDNISLCGQWSEWTHNIILHCERHSQQLALIELHCAPCSAQLTRERLSIWAEGEAEDTQMPLTFLSCTALHVYSPLLQRRFTVHNVRI